MALKNLIAIPGEIVDSLKCPTCGAKMDLVLVGKVNPVYATRCPSVTIPHPTFICTPTGFLQDN